MLTAENLGLSSCLTNKSTLVYLQQNASDELHLLFCFEGTFAPGDVFKPNHFVANVLVQLGGKGSCQRQFLSKIQSKVAMLILCVVLVRVIRLSFLPFFACFCYI